MAIFKKNKKEETKKVSTQEDNELKDEISKAYDEIMSGNKEEKAEEQPQQAPKDDIAFENEVFKSIDASASFSLITPVTIKANAPIHPMTQSLIPSCSSNIIPTKVSSRITKERYCFHFGTWLKSFDSSKIPSSLPSLFGRNLYPINAK